MRIVVDTNVVVSAGLKQSSWPAEVLRWVDAKGGLLESAETERELVDDLRRPRIARSLPAIFVDNVQRILGAAELVLLQERIVACRDPKADKFLELAVGGKADAIVTGDADLLSLDPFREISIVSPVVFIRAQSMIR